MIVVHHLENSRSQRVLWLLEELGVDYEVRRYARNPKTMLAPPELKQIHPLGKSPVIEDDASGSPRIVAETGVIVNYLIEAYGAGTLAPDGGEARLRHDYWLHYAEGSLMPWLLLKLVFDKLSKPPMPLPMRPLAGLIAYGVKQQFLHPQIANHLAFVEGELAGRDWLVDNKLSGADIMMSFPLEAAAARAGLDDYPKLSAFVARVHAREAYRRALERGGPYNIAL